RSSTSRAWADGTTFDGSFHHQLSAARPVRDGERPEAAGGEPGGGRHRQFAAGRLGDVPVHSAEQLYSRERYAMTPSRFGVACPDVGTERWPPSYVSLPGCPTPYSFAPRMSGAGTSSAPRSSRALSPISTWSTWARRERSSCAAVPPPRRSGARSSRG